MSPFGLKFSQMILHNDTETSKLMFNWSFLFVVLHKPTLLHSTFNAECGLISVSFSCEAGRANAEEEDSDDDEDDSDFEEEELDSDEDEIDEDGAEYLERLEAAVGFFVNVCVAYTSEDHNLDIYWPSED